MNINLIGTWTLYKKEVRRFLKVYNQTIFAPVVTSLLFLAIFMLAIGQRVNMAGDIPFAQFMAAGLIMMSVLQNAFANSSSTLIMGKVLGTIIDVLMPPLSTTEIICAFTFGAITRGIVVGIAVGIAVSFFAPVSIHSFAVVIFYILISSLIMALLGILASIFAETFDQMAAITSYIITPLAFLSGTFYSVKKLPEFWYHVSQYNPFFYMIDGFRYGMTGYHDGSLSAGPIFLLVTAAILWLVTYVLLNKGYRIKA